MRHPTPIETASEQNRPMLLTVLARFDGTETSGGSTWYEKGIEWATAKGIVNGFGNNPQGQTTRAQVAQLLQNFIMRM